MPLTLRSYLYILTVVLLVAPVQARKMHPAVKENIKELMRLDSLILKQPELNNKKEMKIGSLRAALSRVNNVNDRIHILNRLFEEYRHYDSDSALKYSQQTYELAQKLNPCNDTLLITALIDQAYMYYIQGYHSKADNILNQITPPIRIKY